VAARVRSWAVVVVVAVAACTPAPPAEGEGEGEGDVGFVGGMRWQITLIEPPASIELDVDAWDLDLFDTPTATIADLQERGVKVICYFSAGTFEPGRPDEAAFPARVIGNGYEDDNFAEERYLDVNDDAVFAIMQDRLDLAVDKGCDAVDPDNVDLSEHDTGFAISVGGMLAFNRALIAAAHARGLAIGLKNYLEVLDDIADEYDFAVNEECVAFDECAAYADNLLAANKPVFHIEYVDAADVAGVCAITQPLGLSTVIKDLLLDDDVTFCP
jgi:hypothetical protein